MTGFHKFHQGPIITMRWANRQELRSRVDVGPEARKHLCEALGKLKAGKRIMVLYQSALKDTWLPDLLASIDKNYEVHQFELPHGEECKSVTWLEKAWDALQSAHFGRADTVVALGGGAVCDLAGFAASTYLRGLKLVLLPTTLLAQVDAALGGKTAVNLASGKNLAGTFYVPHVVLVDTQFLDTLPEREFTSGLAEIIKYGLIEQTISEHSEYELGPRKFFEVLAESLPQFNRADTPRAANPILPGIITACIKMKLSVVAEDLRESGLRRTLNLGHTLGHAIEKVSMYEVSHGEAVSMGITFCMHLASKKKFLAESLCARVEKLFAAVNLPTGLPARFDKDKLVEAMAHDKKREQDAIKFVMPRWELGKVDYNFELRLSEIKEYF